MKFCFRICRGAPLLILLAPGERVREGGVYETRTREGRRGLTKDVGLDSQLDNRGHVSRREKGSERATEGQSGGGNSWTRTSWEAVSGRVKHGLRESPGSTRGAEGRACCREVTEAQGGVSGDTDRGLTGTRLCGCHEIQRLCGGCQNPAQRGGSPFTSRAGRAQRAFPDTPTSRLKGPARRPFPLSAASLHLCPQTCSLLLGIP